MPEERRPFKPEDEENNRTSDVAESAARENFFVRNNAKFMVVAVFVFFYRVGRFLAGRKAGIGREAETDSKKMHRP